MSVIKVASRYASALLEEAEKQGELEAVLTDLKVVSKTVSDNRDLYLLLKSPIVKDGPKKEILRKVFEGQVRPLTLKFLGMLVSKRREMHLDQIIGAFYETYNDHRNIKAVELVSAVPLSDDMESRIVSVLRDQIDAANLDVSKKVDPDLLGGFVIKIEDKVFDASLHNKLNRLKRELLAGS